MADPTWINVLVLDGGGVRGLSSLLILQALMLQINIALGEGNIKELHPQDVFQLVAGTSTGGLIALMLGKMGMTVSQCITQYKEFSKIIFGKKHVRARITRGLAPAKYSGKRLQKCVRRLLHDQQFAEDLLMRDAVDSVADKVACAVICREHCSSSQYSKLKHSAVPICSMSCNDHFICTVCEAARATSAAPTFFPVMKIGDRYFSDGGLAHNNPSFAIYYHYTRIERKKSTGLAPITTTSAPRFSPHGNLNFSQARFTNIGTGAKPEDVEPGKGGWLASLVPAIISKGVFLKQTLTDIAVNSEEKAEFMKIVMELDPKFQYERFDANNGVSNIKLDDYGALDKIEERTLQYLEEQTTKDMLDDVGKAIAKDYLAAHPRQDGNLPLPQPVLEESHQPLAVPALDPPSSSLSSNPSSHSNYSDGEAHGLAMNQNMIQDPAEMTLDKRSTEISLPPHVREDFMSDAHDDFTIEVMSPQIRTVAASA